MTVCLLEYQRADGSWATGHHGVDLKDPERYVERLATRGVTARATDVDALSGCPWCDSSHLLPHDGSCLL